MLRSARSSLIGLAILGLLAVLSGCGAGGAAATGAGPGSGSSNGSLSVDINGGGGGSIAVSDIDGWPSTAPADVPAFPGHVDNLMVGRQNGNGYGVRIFFSRVTTDKFGAYLGALRSAGYKIQGIVYYTDVPNGETHAQARAAGGEYDAVRATKDPRRININVPGSDGTVTYDLDGLTRAENDAMNVAAWPAGWSDKIPAPDGCKLDARSILSIDAAGFRLYCLYAAADSASREQVVNAYVAALEARGFKVLGSDSGGSRTLGNGTYEVAINPDQGGHMYIQVTKAMSMTSGWPSDWIDRVPQPDGCTLGATPISSSSTGFMVACTYPDADPLNHQQLLAKYQAKLQAAGFVVDSTEHDGSQLPNGVSAVNLSRGGIQVRVMPDGAPGGMSISASDAG